MQKKEGTSLIHRHNEVTIAERQPVRKVKKYKEILEQTKTNPIRQCPVRDIMARISDKWSILAILALGGNGKMRFSELKANIGDVSQRMLTVTLRHLEEDGIVLRTIYAEVPPRVEYELTDLGFDLMQQISVLAEWANTNSDIIFRNRRQFQQ